MPPTAEIPYGAYWSTPFAKWQGSFAGLHSIQFAAHVTKRELERRKIAPDQFDLGILGITVPQKHSFYGLPWLAGLIGAWNVGGPTISQACATSARCLLTAAREIEVDMASAALVIACDRVSNGPQIYYPDPGGPGGTGSHENWTLGNFGCDPLGGHSMLETAENVADKHRIRTDAQHALVLRRLDQYGDALADDADFLKRFMTLPFEVPGPDFKKTAGVLQGDEGVYQSTPEGLAALKPVLEGGAVTYGGQTYPADGNAGIIVTSPDKAREISADPNIAVRILGFGLARAERAYMPEAPIDAARRALAAADSTIEQMEAIKTHNPFAVSDLVFAKETGVDAEGMNNFGCSLIWGHPQGPTGLRSMIELIEELALRGGGYGLFTGCAAGDTAMAAIIQVAGP